MKNTIKVLGIIFIIACAFVIAACGPGLEPDPVFTITFDTVGGTPVPAAQTVPNDGTGLAKTPTTNPSKAIKNDDPLPGLYLDTKYTFAGWVDEAGTTFDFTKFITKNTVIKAKWTDPTNLLPTTGNDDPVTKAFDYVNGSSSQTGAANTYTLYITEDAAPTKPLTLNKANTFLTIIGKKQQEIQSPDLSNDQTDTALKNKVFITVGVGAYPTLGNVTTLSIGPTLTLQNVVVEGKSKATKNSMIAVINGGVLNLNKGTIVEKHINSDGGSFGVTGNGSTICVINGSTLNINQGIVQDNQSTATGGVAGGVSGEGSNTNLVGGVYVMGAPKNNPATNDKNKSTVTIVGGDISGNTCKPGNTADIYITELVNLSMEGYVTIGELCINADNNESNTAVGSGTYSKYDYPTFTINGQITNTIKKLNLRVTSSALATVSGAWKDKTVFSGGGSPAYQITTGDVGKFLLWEFTGSASLRGTGKEADDDTKKDTWNNYIPKLKFEITLENNNAKLIQNP
jgi:hypothetical protein